MPLDETDEPDIPGEPAGKFQFDFSLGSAFECHGSLFHRSAPIGSSGFA